MSSLSSSVPLFAGLSKDAISAILSVAVRRKYPARKFIVSANSPARSLFLVHSGAVDYLVHCRSDQEILIRRFIHGDTFGVATLLSEPLGYLGTARAVRDSVLYVWDHATAYRLVKLHPRLAENALHIALHYVSIYSKRHLRLVCDSAECRLAKALTHLGSRTGKKLPSGVDVEVKNHDLASLADISPFTVSRILRLWERHGAIRKRRGHVIIHAPEKMFR